MSKYSKSQLFMALLPQLVMRGDLSAQIQADIHAGKYSFVTPELYVRAQLTFASGQPQWLMDQDTNRAKGTIPLDKGRLRPGNIVLATHISIAWDQIASVTAAEAIYSNTKTDVQAGLLNANVIVEKDDRRVITVPVAKLLPEAAADSRDKLAYELDNPVTFTDENIIKVGVEYPTISGHSFTGDTYLEIMFDGAGLAKK